MSRKRKQPTRRRKGGDSSRQDIVRPAPGEAAMSLAGAGSSEPEFLVPVSCTFHDPETAVTTYEVHLPAEDGRAPGRLPVDLTVVKACQSQFAIEDYPTIRVSRLGFFREDRSSLVWDMQEGVVTSEPRVEERHNDPADLEEQRRIDAEKARQHPFDQAATRVSATTVSVKRRQESSFALGDNCLIYCTAIEPRTNGEWSRLEASFRGEGYDHYSPICQPDMFARALGSMALQQEGLLGSPIVFRHPDNDHAAECRNLSVAYGPVVYVQDRYGYLQRSSSEVEFIIRCIFAKPVSGEDRQSYQDQREYRFAVIAARALDYSILDLTTSAEMRDTLKPPARRLPRPEKATVAFGGCCPSPRILQCISGWPDSRAGAQWGNGILSSQLQGSIPINGIQHQSESTTRKMVQTVDEVDYQIIEQSIADEPLRPDDARLVRFTLDGGPGHIISFYDFGGLNGALRLTRRSNGVHVKASAPEAEEWEMRHLVDATQFGGTFNLDPEVNSLMLSATTMNPTSTVKIDPPNTAPDLRDHYVRLSETEDMKITVTVTSEDGTETSRFSMSIDRDLYMETP